MTTYEISVAPSEATEFKRPSKLNVLIGDVSGSMGWAIRDLVKDTIQRVRDLPEGDAVLIGVFSSQGWWKWIAARELTSKADYDFVATAIERDMRIYGMTCFSDIIGDTPQAIKPFLAKFPVVTCTFMSDGHPNNWPIDVEHKNIIKNIEALRPFITSSIVVAYGDYANRQLLGQMAKTLGGELVTAQTIHEVGEAFARVSAGKARKKRKVKVPEGKPVIVFSLEPDGSVAPLTAENGEYEVSDSASIYGLGSLELNVNFTPTVDQEYFEYAAALALLADNRVEEATTVMSNLGDVAIVRVMDTAITNAEMAKGEEMIRKALNDPSARFTAGRQPGCLPPEDAFDLLDALELLQSDHECKFYPRHEWFKYKKIGRGTKTREGYPEFTAADNPSVQFSKIVGNEKELNLSVLAVIPGTVELPDKATSKDGAELDRETVGLPKQYPCHVFRNYAFVSNALLGVTQLPASLSESVFSILQANRIIAADAVYAADEIYLLDLTAVPACNKARGKSATDWTALCKNAIKSLEIGSIIKVMKAKRNELDPDREAERPLSMTDDQFVFLEACGFRRDGSFSPPVDQEDPIDELEVRVFETKIKGGSAVSIKDFALMAAGSKKQNYVGGLMMKGQEEIDKDMPKTKGPAIDWLNNKLTTLTAEQRKIDAESNARRYAVALGGHWAKNFNEDSASFDVDGAAVTLSFGTIVKKI